MYATEGSAVKVPNIRFCSVRVRFPFFFFGRAAGHVGS